MNLIASSQLIVVLGLGKTGLSVARYLRSKRQLFLAMDSRMNPPCLTEFQQEFTEVNLNLGGFDQDILIQAEEIVVSPGISLNTPEIVAAMSAGAKVVGDVELFAREIAEQQPLPKVIAITGSNAKSTVTTLVGKMAVDNGIEAVIGGNIGTPMLDLLVAEAELYVLELSSFQLETTHSLKPTVATVLNVTEDHMDRYDSLADYHRAKQRIYFGAKSVVVNRVDPLTEPLLAKGVRCYSFGLDQPDRYGFGIRYIQGREMIAHEFNALMPLDKLKVKGRHNAANCLAALAIGYAAGFAVKTMLDTLQGFEGLPHRCQWVARIEGVDFINDSKATNVGATMAALSGFASEDKNIILIAGGDAKGADFSVLKDRISKTVCLLILIGRDARKIAEAVAEGIAVNYADSLDQAVTIAKQNAISGNLVLLSPACASFDMFSGYQQRGNHFIAAVRREAA